MSAIDGLPTKITLLTGPLLVGLVGNWCLFGTNCVQVYIYYLKCPNDSWRLKSLVYGVLLWDIAQTLMLTTTEFDILASGWGNRADLVAPGTGWFDIPVMSGIASAVVQCFYAWRLYALSKSVPLVVVIVVLALTESAAALALGIIVHTTIHSLLVLQSNTYAVTGVWLIGSATCDLVISVSSLWLLSRARRRVAEGNKTRGFINRIIILTVGGGFLTASVAIVDAILYLGFPENNLHFAAAFLLPKLYTNALMVILNNRIRNLNNLTYTWEGEGGEGDSSDASPRNIDLTSLDGSIDSILNAGSRSADVSLGTEHTNQKPEAGG